MAMRMSGLMSGMDTDTIVQELVSARRKKVDTVKKSQTKLEWKQNAWKDLNKKLQNLQSKFISNMRFSSSYMKKVTKVSNSSVASVTAGENAVNGTQSLEVERLAKTAYLTGGKVSYSGDDSLNAMAKLSDLGYDGEDTTLQLTKGNGETTEIAIGKDSTISDVMTQLKNAGLNASFDAGQGRLFISAKKSGEASDFNITAKADDENSLKALNALGLGEPMKDAEGHVLSGASKIDGTDAVIYLNGAKFTNSTNVFSINGLTITANETTKPGESVTLNTQDDTDGIYDMIKDFLKEYNSVINEMDKLYNAESAKGYEPLTDEEKDAMSESEAEKYENKIKDSLLRRDENLSTVSSALKDIMSAGVQVNGKTMYLFDFGIETLGYFNSADNEKNAYHINGDPDDASTSGKTDKLKAMISSDPSTVVSFFTKLSQNLYGKMTDMSKSVNGYRSFGSFYDDKKMKTEYTDYTSKIADQEKRLNDYEDKWYKRFSKMETAMAKMQSNTSAISALLGGGS